MLRTPAGVAGGTGATLDVGTGAPRRPERGGIHYSHPEAVRGARFLRAHSYTATSLDILLRMRPGTYSIAPNTTVAMVREALWRMGLSRELDPVPSAQTEETERGRKVFRYTVEPAFRRLLDALVRYEDATPTPRGTLPDFEAIARQPAGQVPLFR